MENTDSIQLPLKLKGSRILEFPTVFGGNWYWLLAVSVLVVSLCIALAIGHPPVRRDPLMLYGSLAMFGGCGVMALHYLRKVVMHVTDTGVRVTVYNKDTLYEWQSIIEFTTRPRTQLEELDYTTKIIVCMTILCKRGKRKKRLPQEDEWDEKYGPQWAPVSISLPETRSVRPEKLVVMLNTLAARYGYRALDRAAASGATSLNSR